MDTNISEEYAASINMVEACQHLVVYGIIT
jgi:hypothetical protein